MKLKRYNLLVALFVCAICASTAQPLYTALDSVAPYTKGFQPGLNLGQYTGFGDEKLAQLAGGNKAEGLYGAGAVALRPALFEDFVHQFGYDSRIEAYHFFDSLGLGEHTCIVGFPTDIHKDQTVYCPETGKESTLFSNLYEPIWDTGQGGTPVNDSNYYAFYIWNLVTLYGDQIKFWEIWNEPGFDYTNVNGWALPGQPGNWWDADPDPCDYKLRAPIEHYVRMLRISWEVIKALDPEAQVTVSGLGYPSFLDALLRNTDNPLDGSVTAEYPYGGGAYFDCVGFHSYPHFDGALKTWVDSTQSWAYDRNSDAAMRGIMRVRNQMQTVLDDYGFEGSPYPKKNWVLTECHIPRKAFGDFIGSDQAQMNFTLKAWIESARQDFKTLHMYKIAEEQTYEVADEPFETMGLYKQLDYSQGLFQELNLAGIAYATATKLLYGLEYSASRTASLNLPASLDGAAFKHPEGYYTYALWAKTVVDQSEVASVNYSFPTNLTTATLLRRGWDYSHTGSTQVYAPTGIQLYGTPVFLTESPIIVLPQVNCVNTPLAFSVAGNNLDWTWSAPGGMPSSGTGNDFTVTFSTPGTKYITAAGYWGNNTVWEFTQAIDVNGIPTAALSTTINGPLVQFNNTSTLNTTAFIWQYDDGITEYAPASPQHLYLASGDYIVTLTAANACGADEALINVTVSVPQDATPLITALDTIPTFDPNDFGYGARMNWIPGWTDESISLLLSGQDDPFVKGLHGSTGGATLWEYFLDFWGYDAEVPTFQYYQNHGLKDMTVTLSFPSQAHRDSIAYCPGAYSALFKNIYLDIWDDGLDGTPINDENFFAAFAWNVAKDYKNYVRYYEILNAPGFDPEGDNSWKPPGVDGNWWDTDPDACDYTLGAPIEMYVRMLRIAYEVIHKEDPDAFITLSGIGEPSFLDAVLRNSDNPIDGSIDQSTYPFLGGAYIDALGVSCFPHLDGSTRGYDINLGQNVYYRHSDAALATLSSQKAKYLPVLADYGFGVQYPQKAWVLTDINLPSKPLDDFFSGELEQLNFMMKARVKAQTLGYQNFIVKQLSQIEETNEVTDWYGLYKKLPYGTNYDTTIVPLQAGYGLASLDYVLNGSKYDAARTTAMNIPANLDGAAFKNINGQYHYVLWAKTVADQSEEVFGFYTMPNTFGLDSLYSRSWFFWEHFFFSKVSAQNIYVTATPIIFSESDDILSTPLADIQALSPTLGCQGLAIQFESQSTNADSLVWHFPGGVPSSSSDPNPTIIYPNPGLFPVSLTAYNEIGSNTFSVPDLVEILEVNPPNIEYSYNYDLVQFITEFLGGYTYTWIFGDGDTATSVQPEHFYAQNGTYHVTLVITSDCGTDSSSIDVLVNNSPLAPYTEYAVESCAPALVGFFTPPSDAELVWNFPQGNPSTSIAQQPDIFYDEPGTYTYFLTSTNSFGSTTTTGQVTIAAIPNLPIYLAGCENATVCNTATDCYTIDSPTPILLTGGNNGLCDTTYQVLINWLPTYENTISASIANGEVYTYNNQTFTQVGVYPFALTATNGCDSTVYLELQVEGQAPLATASFEIQNCAPSAVIFESNTQNATLIWHFAQGSPNYGAGLTNEIYYNQAGTYEYSVIAINEFGSDTLVGTFELTSQHVININEDACSGDTICIAWPYTCFTVADAMPSQILGGNNGYCDTLRIVNIIWDPYVQTALTDSFYLGDFYEIYNQSFSASGIYQIQVEAANQNCDTLLTLTLVAIDTTVSIEENSLSLLQPVPNPFYQNIFLKGGRPDLSTFVVLTDAAGKIILPQTQISFDANGNASLPQQADLPAGFYFLTVTIEGHSRTFKMVGSW
jgi:PKD repeat protein